MARTIWMDELLDFERKGDVACFRLRSDGETVLVRCERHIAIAAIKLAQNRWCELDREERSATVRFIGKR